MVMRSVLARFESLLVQNADGWQSGRLRRAVNPFLSLDAQVRILLHLVTTDMAKQIMPLVFTLYHAVMVELAYTPDLRSGARRHVGSTPTGSTLEIWQRGLL